MAKIEQMGRGRTLAITGAVGVAGLNELVRDFKKLDKEINKTIRRVNKSIAEEVSNDAIRLGKQQNVQGRPVHRRDRAVKAIKGRARQNQASIELQGHKNDAILYLEFGAIYQSVPKNTNKGQRFRYYTQARLGTLPSSRPGAGRLYRRFVGDKAFQTGFGGYVVGKTIRNALPQIQEEYLERVFKEIKTTLQMAKVVDIPVRISTSGKTGIIRKVA